MSFQKYFILTPEQYESLGGNIDKPPSEHVKPTTAIQPTAPQTRVDDNLVETINTLPKFYRAKAKTIYSYVKDRVSSDGEVEGIVDSHIIDLIKYAIKRSKRRPTGIAKFLGLLKDLKVPKSVYDASSPVAVDGITVRKSIQNIKSAPAKSRQSKSNPGKTHISLKDVRAKPAKKPTKPIIQWSYLKKK